MITKEQWVMWKQDPVTQAFLSDLYKTREELKEGMAEGAADSNIEIYRTQGRCMSIKDAIHHARVEFGLRFNEEGESEE